MINLYGLSTKCSLANTVITRDGGLQRYTPVFQGFFLEIHNNNS